MSATQWLGLNHTEQCNDSSSIPLWNGVSKAKQFLANLIALAVALMAAWLTSELADGAGNKYYLPLIGGVVVYALVLCVTERITVKTTCVER